MPLLKILGVMDLVTAGIIVLYAEGFVSWNFLAFGIIYLGTKTIFFHRDLASYLDCVVGVVLILLIFEIENGFVLLICILYLLQKALRSFT